MSVHIRRPGEAHLERLLERCAGDEITYAPVGVSTDLLVDTTLHRSRWETTFSGDFDRATAALRSWQVHRGAGLTLLADGDPAVGINVAMYAPLPVGCVEVTCRVIAVIDTPDSYGFAYGTLSVHPERGEEAFIVNRTTDGAVHFVVEAASEPAHALARFAPPVANLLQDRACNRYLWAMRQAATTS
jgi:uncharacterized protein (UPF0548 family)